MVGEEPSSFQVPYISPVDNMTLVDLDCSSSKIAKAKADCFGTYKTVEGHKVEISCDIPLGAASGPGCVTRVIEGLRPDTDRVLEQYLEPPVCCGPEYLQSWDQKYLAHLAIHDPTLIPLLEPAVPPVSESITTTSSDMVTTPEGGPAVSGVAAIADMPPEKLRELQTLMNSLLGQSSGSKLNPAKPSTCAPTDYKCQVTKQNMLSPPSARSETIANLIADPCVQPACAVLGNMP